MSAAHRITARGYPITARANMAGRREIQIISKGLQKRLKPSYFNGLAASDCPATLTAAPIARVHLFERRVYLQAEAAKVDAAIAGNLKELGYGG